MERDPRSGQGSGCGFARERYNSGMAKIGDIGVLTTQELAEFIDPIESTGSLDETLAFVGRDSESFGDQLP